MHRGPFDFLSLWTTTQFQAVAGGSQGQSTAQHGRSCGGSGMNPLHSLCLMNPPSQRLTPPSTTWMGPIPSRMRTSYQPPLPNGHLPGPEAPTRHHRSPGQPTPHSTSPHTRHGTAHSTPRPMRAHDDATPLSFPRPQRRAIILAIRPSRNSEGVASLDQSGTALPPHALSPLLANRKRRCAKLRPLTLTSPRRRGGGVTCSLFNPFLAAGQEVIFALLRECCL